MNNARRKWIREIMDQITDFCDQLNTLKDEYLSQIQADEEEAYENLPDGIRDGDRGSAMEDNIDGIEDAMDSIRNAIDSCEEAYSYLDDVVTR